MTSSIPVGVVEEGVDKDEDAGRSAAGERAPPPPVVLHGQLEVGEGDGDARRHDDENQEDESENSPERVGVVAPHGRVDVVQLCTTPSTRG